MSIDISAISRVVGVEVLYKIFESGEVKYLPQRIALIGQGNTASSYSTDPKSITSHSEAAEAYGYGSPLHLAARQLFPDNGDGVGSIPVTAYPMVDDGGGVAATGAIGAVGTQTDDQVYKIKINEIQTAEFSVPKDTTADAALGIMKNAIDAVLHMPLTTGAVVTGSMPVTTKWMGITANDIYIEIVGTEAGIVFTVTQMSGGAVNPDIDTPLAEIVNIWETILVNCLNYDDITTLDKIQTFGDGRWGELSKKPCFSVVGTVADRATRTAVTDARKPDKINVLVPAMGSNELPFVIAARASARIAKKANNLPGNSNFGKLTGLQPGPESAQEDYTNRDLSAKAGSSTTIVTDGEIELNDTVTMYHPDAEAVPGFRYVADIIKLMQVVFNVRIIFESDDWKGAPLLSDDTPTTREDAKKPKDARTALGNLADSLAEAAIITEPKFTKENLTADINSQNSKRLDDKFPVKLSGNVEIIDNSIQFGFYYGN